jgi:hypothetical protein
VAPRPDSYCRTCLQEKWRHDKSVDGCSFAQGDALGRGRYDEFVCGFCLALWLKKRSEFLVWCRMASLATTSAIVNGNESQIGDFLKWMIQPSSHGRGPLLGVCLLAAFVDGQTFVELNRRDG